MNDQPPLALCGWPGLAGLWLQGRWTSLLLAIGFSFLFNLALVSTFVWPALLGDSVSILLWPFLAVVWAVGAWNSWRMLNGLQKNGSETSANPGLEADDTLFIQAQTEYLKGDYQQSETLLAQRLQEDHRDVESRLLLASVLQRSGRLEKATRQLEMLGRLDESRQWRFEIERLRQRIRDEQDDQGELNSDDQDAEQPLDDVVNSDQVTADDEVDLKEERNHEGQSQQGKVTLGEAHCSPHSLLSSESERLDLEDHEDLTDPHDNFEDNLGGGRRAA